ncbi:MAG: M48 family metalloprotease [Pseudobdellovibrionaceae bacterium]
MKNTTKVWIFLFIVSLAHLFIGYQVGDRAGLLLGFFLAVLFNLSVFFFGEVHLLKFTGARQLKGQDPWNLIERIEKFSEHMGITAPDVYVMTSASATAFSLGQPWRKSAICLSTAALEKLNDKELEALLAHQVCHIQRQDTFAFGVTSTIANSFVGLGRWMDFAIPRLKVFSSLLSPLAWLVIRTTVSEKNYFENDDLAASFLHDRKTLAETLWKLENATKAKPLKLPPCTAHLFVVNPLGQEEKNWFFLTHPPLEKRIKRLIGYFPL